MKLIDLLFIISDESNVKIFKGGEEIAEYNGRDSIPNELNDCIVNSVYSGHYFIGIEI